MKLIKYLIVIAIITAVAIIGIDVAKKQGKIVAEFYYQTAANADEVRELRFNRLEHNGSSTDTNWIVRELLFNKDLHEKASKFTHVSFSAAKGYELVAYDTDGNKLGVISYLNVNDDKTENSYEADFDLDNYIMTKGFKVVAEKIEK